MEPISPERLSEIKSLIQTKITTARAQGISVQPGDWGNCVIEQRVAADKNRCCPLTAVVLGTEWTKRIGQMYALLEDALGVPFDWIDEFLCGVDGLQPLYGKSTSAFLLGCEIRTWLFETESAAPTDPIGATP